MLYIFYGTDRARVSSKAHDLIESLRKKAPDAEYLQFSEEEMATQVNFDELISSQGLFKKNYLVLMYDTPPEVELPKMAQSEHIFIIIYGKADAQTKKLFTQYATKAQEYDLKEVKARFNVFTITNALKSKDKVGAWVLLHQARLLGVVGEEITGIIFWAYKDMLLKKRFTTWSESEVRHVVKTLALLPHRARRDAQDVYNAIELFILGV